MPNTVDRLISELRTAGAEASPNEECFIDRPTIGQQITLYHPGDLAKTAHFFSPKRRWGFPLALDQDGCRV